MVKKGNITGGRGSIRETGKTASGLPRVFLPGAESFSRYLGLHSGTSSRDESSTGLKFRPRRRVELLMDCITPRIHVPLSGNVKRARGGAKHPLRYNVRHDSSPCIFLFIRNRYNTLFNFFHSVSVFCTSPLVRA